MYRRRREQNLIDQCVLLALEEDRTARARTRIVGWMLVAVAVASIMSVAMYYQGKNPQLNPTEHNSKELTK